MSGAYGYDGSARWSAVKNIATGDGTTTIQAAPGAGRTLMVQHMSFEVTTLAAQAFDIEDTGSSPVELYKAPASLAVGGYGGDHGPIGIALTANTGLEYHPAAAGVQLTVRAYGYIREA